MRDPFPNTSDQTTEMRFRVIFDQANPVVVLRVDPDHPAEGMVWINQQTGELKWFVNNRVFTTKGDN